jgi:hypothetical protein
MGTFGCNEFKPGKNVTKPKAKGSFKNDTGIQDRLEGHQEKSIIGDDDSKKYITLTSEAFPTPYYMCFLTFLGRNLPYSLKSLKWLLVFVMMDCKYSKIK